ncbi:MAG TPA: PIG-L deacetylase family protein [Candidatus Limnocylindria bacterium]|nr:PIG-L deacetylase family protein [Candidatus Limnocylindria bacterium]
MKFEDLEVQRAMAVYAHPDDAEFGLAGTIAKWARAGVEITYCMVTNGASGSDDPEMTREKLRELRYAEQREAAEILGVKHCVFLGYEDGYLYPTLEVRKDVARQIRIHKPDVLFTMDPTLRVAGDFYVNHPDHIAAGEVALRSVNPDASTRQMFPELWRDEHLEPHKPKALFLQAFGGEGTVIDISDTLETKVKALLVHRSQLGPDAEALVRDFAARIGRSAGYKAGESFRVIRLKRPPEPPKPASRGRRARQRQRPTSTRARATGTRAPTKGTPSRRKRSR